MTFNLIHQPWIPVRTHDGERRLVSIREALLDAPAYRWLDSEACLENTAIHRLLAAILHDAHQGPTSISEAARLYERGHFQPDLLDAYLQAVEDRFDLFSEDAPFWQTPGFAAVNAKGQDASHPVQFLAAHLSSGTNVTLFAKTVDDNPLAVTPATAARWLIAAQNFRPAVGKSVLGKPLSSPLARVAVLTPQGDNLFETLVLSLTVYDPADQPADAPNWRQPPLPVEYLRSKPVRASLGRLDEYTWVAQAFRLHAEDTAEGVRVTRVSWGAGVEPHYPAGTSYWPADPMLAYVTSTKKGVTQRSNALRMRDAHVWRDYTAIIPPAGSNHEPSQLVEHISAVFDELDDFAPVRINLSGQITEQASVIAWRTDVFTVPSAVFQIPLARQTLEQFMRDINRGGFAATTAIETFHRETHTDSDHPASLTRAKKLAEGDAGVTTYWARGELLFRDFIDHLINNPQAATGVTPPDYLERIRRLATDAFEITAAGKSKLARHQRAVALALNALYPLLPRPSETNAEAPSHSEVTA